MYTYVNDKEFLSNLKGLYGNIMQDLCHQLKVDYDIGTIFYLVGSGARNLVLQNNDEPIDLDYNLEIVRCEDYNDCRHIKECVRKSFNRVLRKYDFSNCKDSKSVLTTEKRFFTEGNKTMFSADIAIVYKDEYDNLYRLIHKKTGDVNLDNYVWELTPNSKKIRKKVQVIKKHGKWCQVREQYKKIKNSYLCRNDHNHSSFICYIEAVNNVYNRIKQFE